MGQTLYLECNSGISGDMTVAALLDLGADVQVLKNTLATLPLEGYHIEITRVKKSGLIACDFNVVLEPELENHDHDMAYLHGLIAKEQSNLHNHNSNYLEQYASSGLQKDRDIEAEEYAAHEGGHTHRGLREVLEIIRASAMTERAKTIAGRVFTILGEAEAKAHGETLETVHFHEVGAVDSIVDICAVAICIDLLDITEVIVPALSEGRGTIRCAHGILPIPVPAVSAIVTKYHIPLQLTPVEGELVTPTGAAIVAALRTSSEMPQKLAIERIGLGAGKREYERPSLLRAMIIESISSEPSVATPKLTAENSGDYIVKLETTIDDCSGEAMGFLLEELMHAGARDAHYIPCYMKKNRPAYELVVICTEELRPQLEELIFVNTTTIGIRRCAMERTVLPRKFRTVLTPYGDVPVKVVTLPSGEQRFYPEYEDIATICRAHSLGYSQVYHEIVALARIDLLSRV